MSKGPGENEDTPNPDGGEDTPDPENPGAGGEDTPENKGGSAPTKEELKEVLDMTRQVRDRLQTPDQGKVPSPTEVREHIKEQTGMTDQQIDFTLNTAASAAAPALAELAISNMYRSKADFKDFEKDVRDELKKYPLAKQGDNELVEKIYFMVKGKKMSDNPAPKPSKGNPPANPRGPVSHRIVNHGNVSDTGLEDRGRGGNDTQALSPEEKNIARKMGISEKDYARAKGETVISKLK